MKPHIQKLMKVARFLEGQTVKVITEDGEELFGILVGSTQPTEPDVLSAKIGQSLGIGNLTLNGIYINTGRKISFVDYDHVATLDVVLSKEG